MKAVIYKDLMLVLRYMALMFALMTFMSLVSDTGFLMYIPALFMAMPTMINSVLFFKDPATEPYFKASPLRAKEIVAGRYMINWAIALLGMITFFVYLTAVEAGDIAQYGQILALLPLLFTILPDILLPVSYKVKAAYLQPISLLLYIVIVIGAQSFKEMEQILLGFLESLHTLPPWSLILIPLALAVILNAASYLLSVKVYEQKEC